MLQRSCRECYALSLSRWLKAHKYSVWEKKEVNVEHLTRSHVTLLMMFSNDVTTKFKQHTFQNSFDGWEDALCFIDDGITAVDVVAAAVVIVILIGDKMKLMPIFSNQD